MKKVLILGVNGFIGHHLSRRIIAETDWEVYGMDMQADRIEGLLAENVQLSARSASTAASNKVSLASVASSTEVKSTESGRVVEVIKSAGDKVNEGEALIRVERQAGKEYIYRV